MTNEQFREALHRLGLSLVELAELLGVSPRTASRWAAENAEEIPGPVAAYLGLMLRLRPEDRAAEIGRLSTKGNGMHDGMYYLSFTGLAGIGDGYLNLQGGRLQGADAGGVLYDGSYGPSNDRAQTLLNVRVTVPPGADLVTGAKPPRGAIFDLSIRLPAFAREAQTVVLTPFGPVTVQLRWMRGLAVA